MSFHLRVQVFQKKVKAVFTLFLIMKKSVLILITIYYLIVPKEMLCPLNFHSETEFILCHGYGIN